MNKRTTRTRHSTSKRTAPRQLRTRNARNFKVMTRLLIAICIVIGGGAVLSKAARPYLVSHSEAQEIIQIEKQIADIEVENEELRSDIEYLRTPEGMEVGARRLGWVKQNEIVVMIEEEPWVESDSNEPEPADDFRYRIDSWIEKFRVPPDS